MKRGMASVSGSGLRGEEEDGSEKVEKLVSGVTVKDCAG